MTHAAGLQYTEESPAYICPHCKAHVDAFITRAVGALIASMPWAGEVPPEIADYYRQTLRETLESAR